MKWILNQKKPFLSGRQNIICRPVFILMLFILFTKVANAADILYEQQWTRIISGDQATRLTREIPENPQPVDVRDKTIITILKAMDLADQNSKQLQAWQKGLERYGWTQQENEPEYESYRVFQLINVMNSEPHLLGKIYTAEGQTRELAFDLNGRLLSDKTIAIPETLDRTVFYTVKSPALFVLNQEHFQKHFFEGMLNLDYPGLEAVKKAYEEKKILLAAHELAEYFRRKKHPVWPTQQPEKKIEIDEASEKVLRHEFAYRDSTIYMGERVDFRNNPTNSNEWIWGLNRMGHWVTLLNGYLKTEKEDYAQEYNAEVIDWTVRNPAPSFRLTRVPSWRNLEAGIRMSGTWPNTFFGFLASPSFQTQTIQLMLASMWSHAKHIKRFPSGQRFVNNWVIIGSNGLASVGMNFPEFQDAELWAQTGLQRLSDQLDKQVYPDGMQHELATGYHLACMHSFYQAYDMAQKTATLVPPDFKQTLEKMFEYVMYVSTPSRQVPPTNDAHRNDITNWMNIGADLFERDDMKYIATDGVSGQQPEQTSIQFPWGGHSVMRSDWNSDAWHLFFDAGPAGVSHQHEDKLNIDVSAFGRDFITDGGKGLYIPDKWRNYFLSTSAHNTILIDGQGQLRIPYNETHRVEAPLKNSWYSDDDLDFASGSYSDGYGAERIPVTHSRYVLFKKNEYWLVLDYLTGDGEHEFESLVHFTPCQVRLNKTENSLRTLYDDGKNIKLVSTASVPVQIEVVEGQENPEQGWISHHSGERIAAPTAIFKGKGSLPVLIATVIQPISSDANTAMSVRLLKSPQNQANVVVQSTFGEDKWSIRLDQTNGIKSDELDGAACVQFTRTDQNIVKEHFNARFKD